MNYWIDDDICTDSNDQSMGDVSVQPATDAVDRPIVEQPVVVDNDRSIGDVSIQR